MSTMAFYSPGDTCDIDFMGDHLDMSMEYDLEKEVDKILQGSDKFGYDTHIFSNENSNQGFEFDANNTNIDEWISNMQWNDMVKLNNNHLLDTSFEVENNNPNLLVNPQTGMPVNHYSPLKKPIPPISGGITIMKQESNSESDRYTPGAEHNITIDHDKQQVLTTAATQLQSLSSSTPNILFSGINNNIPIQAVKTLISKPSQNSPVLVEHLQQRANGQNISKKKESISTPTKDDRVFPKPVYSYSCLIAMALKNSLNGSLPVSEIYNFMTEHFPYFKTAPDGWKNSVRHNLSLNKCFAKVETPKMTGNNSKKGCLWALNPEKIEKMDDEIAKHRKKDLESIRNCMPRPELLELIEAGKAGPVGPKEDSLKSSSSVGPIRLNSNKNSKEQTEYILHGDSLGDTDVALEMLLDSTRHTVAHQTRILPPMLRGFSRPIPSKLVDD